MSVATGHQPASPLTSEDDVAVELRHVVKQYSADGPAVLDDVSLGVRPGEFVSLVGASGCGKSTLLNLVSGLDGRDVRNHRGRREPRRSCSRRRH